MSLVFSPYALGDLELPSRIVMAPMTRSRATGNVPNAMMAEYYAQRAGAGLIVSEGTSPSPNGLGYPRIPGIYSDEQVLGWRRVTDAVHAAGGRIFVQLMHTGRISHPLNLPEGARVLAPSAVAAGEEMFTDQEGMKPLPEPEAMTAADIEQALSEFVTGSRNAIEAGFDGVELHGANGYLLEQFFRPSTNRREDEWGGPVENRARFVLEAVRRCAAEIGAARLGIRLSPFGVFNDMPVYDAMEDDYLWLAERLTALAPAYVHLVDHEAMGAPPVPPGIKQGIRERFGGTLILCGGYDRERAEADLERGAADLVAVGRPFISNPDLPARWKRGAALREPDPETFYTPGEVGYTDYAA